MNKIINDPDGIVLVCHDCSHVERVNTLTESLGSGRTRAARAMQNHSREKHGTGSVLKPIQNKLGNHGTKVTSWTVPIPRQP
jgi:type II secretory pathway predicted ATPase ExeA